MNSSSTEKLTTKTFNLVPSVQGGTDLPSPISLMPALPVRLGEEGGATRYAVVDTSAEMSAISSSLASKIEPAVQPIETRSITTVGGVTIHCSVIKISLYLCDKQFHPWVRVGRVPFVVIPESTATLSHGSIILGYDSCLAKLLLVVDFPHKRLEVSAPSSLLASKVNKVKVEVPTRILEGEKLIRIGSYNGAVAVISAGLEEALLTYLKIPSGNQTLGRLNNMIANEAISPKIKDLLVEVKSIRNRAIHGESKEGVSEADAKKVLRNARKAIQYLEEQTPSP